MTTLKPKEQLLTRSEAANFLKIKPGTLATWASSKRYNLSYYKVGSKVVYKLSELESFLEEFKMGGVHV
jgi:Helix-turn-helix domain